MMSRNFKFKVTIANVSRGMVIIFLLITPCVLSVGDIRESDKHITEIDLYYYKRNKRKNRRADECV
jgi:hypothetical protein